MSVIVKGMEMPTCCEWCEVEKFEQNSDGYIIDSWCPAISDEPSTFQIRRESRHSLCPLSPLPYVHGDLIDRDTISGKFVPSQAYFTEEIKRKIGLIPAIVEAEGDDG